MKKMKKIIIIFLVFIPALINAQTYITSGSVLTGLPTSGTYFKSLGVTSNGTLYTKDTLAVSGVYALINSNTTGSAATLTTPRLINGTSFNGSADISVDIFTKAYQALGSTIVAQNVDGNLADANSSLTMISQRSYWSLIYLPVATTLTGVKWKQVTAGNYTANNYNGVGLYSISGGTCTLVASSTDDGNIWKATSGTIASKAFSSTYAAAAGVYMVVALHSSSANTTSPVIGMLTGFSGFINTTWDFTNSAKSSGLISSLTALPSPTQAFSGMTASTSEAWFGVY